MNERQVIVRFLDGPLSGQGNLLDLAGNVHTFSFPEEQYGWPLPERLCVLAHLEHTANVAIWDPATEAERENALPVEIRESPNRVTYRKVGESQLSDEQIAATEHLVRGAQYRLETT